MYIHGDERLGLRLRTDGRSCWLKYIIDHDISKKSKSEIFF